MNELKYGTMVWWCENQQWATLIPEKGSLSSCGYTCGEMRFEYLPLWAQEQLLVEVGEETE